MHPMSMSAAPGDQDQYVFAAVAACKPSPACAGAATALPVLPRRWDGRDEPSPDQGKASFVRQIGGAEHTRPSKQVSRWYRCARRRTGVKIAAGAARDVVVTWCGGGRK